VLKNRRQRVKKGKANAFETSSSSSKDSLEAVQLTHEDTARTTVQTRSVSQESIQKHDAENADELKFFNSRH
jgi:hypothetical protein